MNHYEKNIDRDNCNSYQVKEGDYIQVITPTGRQCSDFVAYDTQKLDKGKENGLIGKQQELLWVILFLDQVYFQNFMM